MGWLCHVYSWWLIHVRVAHGKVPCVDLSVSEIIAPHSGHLFQRRDSWFAKTIYFLSSWGLGASGVKLDALGSSISEEDSVPSHVYLARLVDTFILNIYVSGLRLHSSRWSGNIKQIICEQFNTLWSTSKLLDVASMSMSESTSRNWASVMEARY